MLDHLHDVGGCAAVLWHNDRFDGVYGRGWDRLYDRLLDGIAARGGHADTARRPCSTTGAPSDARPDRVVLLPAGRRRGGAARAQALRASAGARDRRRRAGAGRPEVERPRSWPGRRHPARDRRAPRALPRPLARGDAGCAPGRARTACAHWACALRCSAAASCCRIPEIAWLADAVRAGTRAVRERAIDVVLSTSPPNSVHVIGAAIARRSGVPLRGRFPRLVARQSASALRAAQRAREERGRGTHRARARCAASRLSAP